MSKSRGNVVDPDAEVKKYGADSVRMYLAFMGPYDQNASWQMQGVTGLRRFLEKVWKLKSEIRNPKSETNPKSKIQNPKLDSLLHKTIKKVTDDIENLRFNTAISSMMILVNKLEKEKNIPIANYQLLITLLSPFAPHIAEEIWEQLGHEKSIFFEKWPKYDPKLVRDEEITLIIQVNGKVRDQLKLAAEASEEEAKKMALENEKVKKYIGNQEIQKTVFVPNRLINFVIKS
jgi:leucyl-tRNA synthetase